MISLISNMAKTQAPAFCGDVSLNRPQHGNAVILSETKNLSARDVSHSLNMTNVCNCQSMSLRAQGSNLNPLVQDTFSRSVAQKQAQPQAFQPTFRGISVPEGKTQALLNRIRVLYDSVSKNSAELAQDSDLGDVLGTNTNKKYEVARDYFGLARAYLTYNPNDPLCRFHAQRHVKKALALNPESQVGKGIMATLESNKPKHSLDEKTAAALKKIEQLDASVEPKVAEFNSQKQSVQDPDLAAILGASSERNPELGKDFSDLAQAYVDYNPEDDLCRFHAHGHATTAIIVDPQNHHAHFLLGKLEADADDALPHLKKAVSLSPYNAEYLNVRAIRSYYEGDKQSAINDYTRLTEIEPKVAKHRIQKAYALLDLDKPQEALKDLEKACELEPKDFECHSAKATTLMQLGDYDGAIKSYKTALSLHPDKDTIADTHANLGSAYFAKGNYGKAIKHLDKAIKRIEEPEALYTRAMTNIFLARFDKAAADAESARYGGLDDPSAFTVESLAHAYMGNQDKVENVMTEAYSKFPDHDFDADATELEQELKKYWASFR